MHPSALAQEYSMSLINQLSHIIQILYANVTEDKQLTAIVHDNQS